MSAGNSSGGRQAGASQSVLSSLVGEWQQQRILKRVVANESTPRTQLLQLPQVATHATKPCDAAVVIFGDYHAGQDHLLEALARGFECSTKTNTVGAMDSSGFAYTFFSTSGDPWVQSLTHSVKSLGLLREEDAAALGSDGRAARSLHFFSVEGQAASVESTVTSLRTALETNAKPSYGHIRAFMDEQRAGGVEHTGPESALGWAIESCVFVCVIDASKPALVEKQLTAYSKRMQDVSDQLVALLPAEDRVHLQRLNRCRVQSYSQLAEQAAQPAAPEEGAQAAPSTSDDTAILSLLDLYERLPELRPGELIHNAGIPTIFAITYVDRLASTDAGRSSSLSADVLASLVSTQLPNSQALQKLFEPTMDARESLRSLERAAAADEVLPQLPFDTEYADFLARATQCFATPVNGKQSELLTALVRAYALRQGAAVIGLAAQDIYGSRDTRESANKHLKAITQLVSMACGGWASFAVASHLKALKDVSLPAITWPQPEFAHRTHTLVPFGIDSQAVILDSLREDRAGSFTTEELASLLQLKGEWSDEAGAGALAHGISQAQLESFLGVCLPTYPASLPGTRAHDIAAASDSATDFRATGAPFEFFAWSIKPGTVVTGEGAGDLKDPFVVALSQTEDEVPHFDVFLESMYEQQEQLLAQQTTSTASPSDPDALRRLPSIASSLPRTGTAESLTPGMPSPAAAVEVAKAADGKKDPKAFFANLSRGAAAPAAAKKK